MSKYSEKSSVPEIESELYKILWELHNHINKSDAMDKLIKELENFPQITKEKSLDFCKSYVILVIEKYIDDINDREMLLASYGLLKGLEFKPRKLYRRMRIYRDNAQNYNAFCKNTLELENDSFSTICRNELRRITIKLEEKLTNAKNKNNGKLGLIDKVPAKLELPEPIYLLNTYTFLQSTELEPREGKNIIIDMTKSAYIKLTEISNTIKTATIEISEKTKLVIDASKADLVKIVLLIIVTVGLSYSLISLLGNSVDTQTDNTYVKEEPQQSNVPDVTKSSDGGIEYDNREKNGELETSF